MKTIRVLIVDDSPTVCAIIRRGLQAAEGIEVIGMAPDPYVARDLIVKDPPDVVTLDIEMPRMDGLTFLGKLMKHFPLPVVVVSTLTQAGSSKALEALSRGAVEVVGKNVSEDRRQAFVIELVGKVRAAARAQVRGRTPAPAAPPTGSLAPLRAGGRHLLAVGASTGGTEALARILERLPENTPPTVIVQHMPPVFTRQLAARLDGLSAMTVREATDGETLTTGLALLAPGDRHLILRRQGATYRVELKDGPKVSGHKPSVDVLFRSVAEAAKADAVGVILTGMGADGAQGLLQMRQAGAETIGQDEASCIVYGMPREAALLGAVGTVVPLDRIAERICRSCEAVRA
ncbi:MAG: chemotaxis response regulator protein-glutamate methylesterase [bacterium]|nr:chemotaxis response regulator protein-glutamate methylesterase [bacterium]